MEFRRTVERIDHFGTAVHRQIGVEDVVTDESHSARHLPRVDVGRGHVGAPGGERAGNGYSGTDPDFDDRIIGHETVEQCSGSGRGGSHVGTFMRSAG